MMGKRTINAGSFSINATYMYRDRKISSEAALDMNQETKESSLT